MQLGLGPGTILLSSGGLAFHEAKHFFHWHSELQAQKQESQPGMKTNLTFPFP